MPDQQSHYSIWATSFSEKIHEGKQPPIHELTLKDLTIRLTFLLLILSGKRGQTIHLLNLTDMDLSESKCVFSIREKIKTTRLGHHIAPITYEAYPHEPELCIVRHLKEYIERTNELRSSNCKKLLISFIKPHQAVSRNTISRWCKTLLNAAGIDTKEFGSHSTRAASASFAATQVGDMTKIVESIGWSNATTFQTFYNKPIKKTFNLGSTILRQNEIS
ncbi:uncharacterized protein LOC124437192 [Xenia sp. Carnegie-2017]|uniref:uncharacterized protein LOC124437192 n=1 Tax=Xenia sp. Carnegie-2017 TaxID=2897299 RepID=UPI001F049D72|nr:uncharacterized protein LOC124437192 [Xenia sp. Carnegie-2017]